MKKHLKLIFLCVSMLFALTIAFGCDISFPSGGTSGGVASWGYGSGDTMESKSFHEHYFDRHPSNEYLKSPATCTKRAVYYYSCYECGAISNNTFEYGDYAPHTIVTDEAVEPTCTKSGLTEGEHCEECNEIFIKQEEIPALGHDIINHEGKPATCTETGLTEGQECSVCGEILIEQKEIERLPHTEEIIPAVEATCSAIGLTEGKRCSVCNEILVEQNEIDKLPHTEEILPSVAATCLDTGVTEGKKCSVCGEILIEQDIIKALGHNYGDWIIDKSATCATSGSKHKVCSRCDDKQTQTIYAFGHNYGTWITESQATCTTSGNKYKICSRCRVRSNQTIEKLGHNYSEWRVRKSATCTTTGINYSVCTRSGCNDEITTETPALGHYYVDGICSRCKAADPSAETYTISGNYIYFGNYPQTQVTNSSIISTLNSMAGALPSDSNNQNWTSYGYYMSGSNSTAYMWYQDMSYNGEKYRGVYFISYRPSRCSYRTSAGNSFQDENGYSLSIVYWFKYESVKWRILTKESRKAFLMCDIAIDSQQYYHNSNETRTINGETVYPNNYAESEIRRWLNNTFYNTAFSSVQKSFIQTIIVDNSERSTNPYNNAEWWDNGRNSYACKNTSDKVFLLSEYEVTNPAYGFDGSPHIMDTARRLNSSDYAKSQGCYQDTIRSDNGRYYWWLRSPYYLYGRDMMIVDDLGNPLHKNDDFVNRTNYGAVPALWINL